LIILNFLSSPSMCSFRLRALPGEIAGSSSSAPMLCVPM